MSVDGKTGIRARAGAALDPNQIDYERMEGAIADLLDALGVDITDESLQDTPRRVAAAYSELLTPLPFEATTFPNDEGYDELVVARGIPFHSLCEHHLIPFVGGAHGASLPGERIAGLSKLARVVERYARRLQVQERMTVQIADWLEEELQPRGVGVGVDAAHLCMTIPGAPKPRARTTT